MSELTVLTIKDAVAAKLASSTPQVNQAVIDHLAGKEVERRIQAVLNGLVLKDSIEKQINKIKPDQVSLNEHGEEVNATYSKAKYDELKKLREKLNKLGGALSKALDGDYSTLFDYLEKNKQNQRDEDNE